MRKYISILLALIILFPSMANAARPLKEDTAVTVIVGPFHDPTDGVTAELALTVTSMGVDLYKGSTKSDITTTASGGDNDMVHVANGYYSLELTAGNTDTAGNIRISFNPVAATVIQAVPIFEDFEIVSANFYDSEYGTDKLQVDLTQILGTALTETSGYLAASFIKFFNVATPTGTIDSLPDAVPGAAGGVFIAGTNVATVISSSTGSALTLSSTGSNGHGMEVSGNGTGSGIESTGGATGHGIEALGGATSGNGLEALAQTEGDGIHAKATGTTQHGLFAEGGSISGNGLYARAQAGSGNGIAGAGNAGGAGLQTSGGATGAGFHVVGGSSDGYGINVTTTDGNGIRVATGSNGNAVLLEGSGSGEGIHITGGTTGHGIQSTGGATSGAGIYANAQNNNDSGMELVGNGTGADLEADSMPTADAIKTAMEADGSKLDHLWETTEDDAGVRRFTANALEEAPSGTGTTPQLVWEYGTRTLTAGTNLNDPSAATIADAVWDEVLTGNTHNTATTAGRRLRELTDNIMREETAQAGSTNTITLDAAASATDNWYDPAIIAIYEGTGAGQSRRIIDYVGSTKVATVNQDWRTNPSSDSVFTIFSDGGLVYDNEGAATGGAAGTITLNAQAVATDDIYNGQLIATVSGTGKGQVRKITDYDGASKVATVNANWTTNPAAGTGYFVMQHGYAADLATAAALATVDSEVGAIQTDLDNATDGLGALSTLINDIPTTSELALRTLPAADYTVVSDLGIVQSGDSYAIVNGDHGLVSIQDDVDEILTDTGTTIPGTITTVQTDLDNPSQYMATGFSVHDAADVWTAESRALSTPNDYKADVSALALASICTEARLARLDAAISSRSSHDAAGVWSVETRTITDKAGFTISGTKTTLDSLNDITSGNVETACGTALTTYDPPTYTEMVAAFTEIKGATWSATDTLEAIRDQGDSAWITATAVTVSDKTGFALSAAGVDDILDEAVDSTRTMRKILTDNHSVLTGKSTGGGTGTIVYKDIGENDQVTITVDEDRNRTESTLGD